MTRMGSGSVAEIRAIVLDFNGTLAQDDHLVAPLYVEMFASLGLPLTAEDYHREFAAMPDRDGAEVALRRAGLPVDEAAPGRARDGQARGIHRRGRRRAPDRRARARLRPGSRARGSSWRSPRGRFGARSSTSCQPRASGTISGPSVSIDDVANGKPDPRGSVRALAVLNAVAGASRRSSLTRRSPSRTRPRARRPHGRPACAWQRSAGSDTTEGSGYADLVVERLDRGALAQMLVLGSRAERR